MKRPRPLKDLTPLDLNEAMIPTRDRHLWAMGMLEAANLINEMYSTSTIHLYAIGDCMLAKLNLLREGKKVRRNPGMLTAIEAAAKQRKMAEKRNAK